MERAGTTLEGLASKTLLQLRELAQRLGIQRYSSLDRTNLISAVSQANPPQAEPQPSIAHAESAQPAPTPAPPEATTQVVFLPRDPQWAYAFWEISSSDRQQAEAAGATQLCLRVADVTALPLGASHPHALQEIVVDARGYEWYVPVPLSDRDYRVELGFRLRNGGWYGLA